VPTESDPVPANPQGSGVQRLRRHTWITRAQRSQRLAQVALLATLALPVIRTVDPGWSRSLVRLARSDADDERDLDRPSRSVGSHAHGVKSPKGGYDPQRIKRFWRHYHGARPEKKEKPLERTK